MQVSGQEPNVIDEEQEAQGQAQEAAQNLEPTPPKRPKDRKSTRLNSSH